MLKVRKFFPVILATGILYFVSPAHIQAQLNTEDWDKLNIWKAEPLKVKQNDDELKRLFTQRYNEALSVVQLTYKDAILGKALMEHAQEAGWRLLNASLEVYESPKERTAFLKELWELADIVERIQAARVAAGATKPATLHLSRQFRLDVDIQLLKAKKKAADKDKR